MHITQFYDSAREAMRFDELVRIGVTIEAS